MVSWRSQIVMVIVHLPGICIFGSLPLLSFFTNAVNSTFQASMFFFDKLYNIVGYFIHFETV